jgi:hypothetical protein
MRSNPSKAGNILDDLVHPVLTLWAKPDKKSLPPAVHPFQRTQKILHRQIDKSAKPDSIALQKNS